MTTSSSRAMKVAINAQLLPDSGAGGIESVLVGLIKALGRLDDGPEEYVIIGHWRNPAWLERYIGPNQRIVRGPKPYRGSPVGRMLRPLRPATRSIFRILNGIDRISTPPPMSNGFYEGLQCDVIHFPYQHFVVCGLPAIFNPHDLQHLHYPRFFTPAEIVGRETLYPAGCHFAQSVVVASQWVKQDIVEQYGLSPRKIQVIPWAPPTEAYPDPAPQALQRVREKYAIPVVFALYPSMTWPHKNHIRLLEAIALLRDRDGLVVHLVCTGQQNTFWPEIEARLRSLGLQNQVKFLGMIPPEDLRSLYRLAEFVVIPTLFEAASGPLYEAWFDNVPVACSTVTSLPEQAADAALLFDPFSVGSIADAVAKMASNPALREDLKKRGRRRLGDFSWERTAKAYRAVYRRAAHQPLSEEDRWLLSHNWTVESVRPEAPVK